MPSKRSWNVSIAGVVAAVLFIPAGAVVLNYVLSERRIEYSLERFLGDVGISDYEIVSTYYLERPVLFGDQGGAWLIKLPQKDRPQDFWGAFASSNPEDKLVFLDALSRKQIVDLGDQYRHFDYYRDERNLGRGTICEDVSCSFDVISDGSLALVRVLAF